MAELLKKEEAGTEYILIGVEARLFEALKGMGI